MKYVVILDFGYTKDPSIPSTIHDLGECALDHGVEKSEDVTVLAQSATYEYLCRKSPTLARSGRLHEIKVAQSGNDNSGGLKDGGSYFVLKRAYAMLKKLDLSLPPYDIDLVAHELHVPRAMRQARLVGFHYVIPYYNVPTKLYRAAAQWWCRNKFLWYLRELIGFIPLKLAKQL